MPYRAAVHIFAVALFGGLSAPISAAPLGNAPTFARIFGDHSVLQRDRPLAIWGQAAPHARVRVTLGGGAATAVADASGKWQATLPAHHAGGPYTLTATADGVSTNLADVMVGDVYLCGGQSNMEFPARLSTGAWSGLGSPADSGLRFATIVKDSEPAPLADLHDPAPWKIAGPDTIPDASAVCYYMARALRKSEHVPVGFVAADWGGTTIQGWISAGALATLPAYRERVAQVARLAVDAPGAHADEDHRQEAWWDAHDPQASAERAWIAPGFDDTGWPVYTPNGSWKDAGVTQLSGFDGVVWLRKRVDLTAAQAAAATQMQLGPVDTFDTTWINGHRVGSGGTAWAWRIYDLPAGTLHAGANEIVLRVLGGGGPTGDPAMRGIRTTTGELIPLEGAWRYRTGMRATGLAVPPAPWDVPTSLTTLYNGMIAPIARYGWKLAAWYQGESNVGAANEYATLLPMLMADWRRASGEPELPFAIVQLANYGTPRSDPAESGWAELRAAQARVARADPHAALAVTIDVGDRFDIHPSQKLVVGERLANAARVIAYHHDGVVGGPEAIAVTRSGGDLIIQFRNTGAGLRSYGASVVIGFEVCAVTRCHFVPGEAAGSIVRLRGAGDTQSTRVRYAWADAPITNLYGGGELPVVPFELPVKDHNGNSDVVR